MTEKKDIPVGFKLSESDKKRAEVIADKFGHKPGSLAGILLRSFMDAYEQHGENLKFPPSYDFYEEGSYVTKKSESHEKRDAFGQAG